MMYHSKNDNAKRICAPRWLGYKEGVRGQRDPCGGCPLVQPCVNACPRAPGIEAYNNWIDGINALADKLTEENGQKDT